MLREVRDYVKRRVTMNGGGVGDDADGTRR